MLELKGMPAGTKSVKKQRVALGQALTEETEVNGAFKGLPNRLAPSASSREDPARGTGMRPPPFRRLDVG